MSQIPQSEIDSVIRAIRSNPQYLDPDYVIGAYRACGLDVIPDPFAEDVLAPVRRALTERRPLSVIRIGDGEANLMTYGYYADTGNLDRYVIEAAMAMQEDAIIVDECWNVVLRDLMMGAVAQADIIGVVGLWRSGRPTAERFIERFLSDLRGFSGHWRAIDYLLNLAGRGFLGNKTIASAHLYFSVLEYLDTILPLAERILVISSRDGIVDKLRKRHPDLHFDYVAVANSKAASGAPLEKPTFLSTVFSALPQDMRGCLCLIGAGIWAELYCTWIRQRGGVALDIGSGCDLLDGDSIRPIHRTIQQERLQRYRL
jgi:hypothetical protein